MFLWVNSSVVSGYVLKARIFTRFIATLPCSDANVTKQILEASRNWDKTSKLARFRFFLLLVKLHMVFTLMVATLLDFFPIFFDRNVFLSNSSTNRTEKRILRWTSAPFSPCKAWTQDACLRRNKREYVSDIYLKAEPLVASKDCFPCLNKIRSHTNTESGGV